MSDLVSRLLRIACLLAAIAAHLAPACAEAEPPVTVRIEWGGGRPRAWSGTIRIVDGDLIMPTGPGLGVDLRDDGLARYTVDPRGGRA